MEEKALRTQAEIDKEYTAHAANLGHCHVNLHKNREQRTKLMQEIRELEAKIYPLLVEPIAVAKEPEVLEAEQA